MTMQMNSETGGPDQRPRVAASERTQALDLGRALSRAVASGTRTQR
jgi:hypothetical protein